jgi:hypothetical protein
MSYVLLTKLSEIWVWDLGSEIRDPENLIPDPGVKNAPDPGNTGSACGAVVRLFFLRVQILALHSKGDPPLIA